MSFTNPSFLWALFAMLIPLIIHLINLRKPKLIYFSNTAIIDNVKKETRTKTKLKQILILIARMLTIGMLVFAFAGPFIPNKADMASKQSDITIIYIDNSFSMDADAAKGKVFDQAKKLAKDIVFANPTTMNYIFMSNTLNSEYGLAINRDQIISCIDECRIGANTLGINDLLIKVNAFDKTKKVVLYVISDMQASSFENISNMPNDNIDMILVPLNTMKINNLYIDTCFFETPVHKKGQYELLKVEITNKSNENFYDIPLQLFINDSLKTMTSFNVDADQSVTVDIQYQNTLSGNVSAKLEISDYPIVYDNTLYFNYYVSDYTKVLSINAKSKNRYLTALYGKDTDNFYFEQISQKTSNIELSKFDFVILNSVSEISSGMGAELKNFINNGGSVCLIPDVIVDYASLNNFLGLFGVGKFEAGITKNLKLYKIDYNDELYKGVFSKEEKQLSLPNVELAHKLNLYANSSFSTVLSLENTNPVIVSGNYGGGKLYLFTTPISDVNADFAKSIAFVPAMYNIAQNSQIENSLYATINAETTVAVRTDSYNNADDTYRIKGESVEYIADVRYNSGLLKVFVPEDLKISGTFDLYKNEEKNALISLNYDRKESMQDYLSDNELKDINNSTFGGEVNVISSENMDTADRIKEFSEGKFLWKLFILLSFLFILCEISFIKFLK